MKLSAALSLFLALLWADIASAQDADRLYRVEILVLSHLDHGREAEEWPRAGDYSGALDFLTPAPEGSEGEPVIVTTELAPGATSHVAPPSESAGGPDGPASAETDDPLACTSLVLPVTEMGPEMSEAWRRLRLSAPFRPLQYLSWQQPGTSPFPLLRVHDGEVVFTEDPWAEWRQADAEAEQAALASGAAFSPGPLPPPVDHYRLDGTAQLARTRFLHLDLELEWREPVWLSPPTATPVDETRPPGQPPAPDAFRVHRLEQRRQVRTGRMEYFDTPVLGVLALVTDVSHLLPEPEEE